MLFITYVRMESATESSDAGQLYLIGYTANVVVSRDGTREVFLNLSVMIDATR